MVDLKEIKLKVAEAIQDDVDKGIARIDSSIMRQIDVRPGDVIEIKGERKTVAIIDRAYPGDIGLNIIRMDGIIRRNAKTGIGEIVQIKKTEIKEAKKVVIAPARKGIIVRASANTFKQGLLGRAIVKGDIVALGGTRRRRNTMTGSPFFEDIFRMLEEESVSGFGFGDIKFIVADTNPKEGVLITDVTEVILNPEAIELKEEIVPDVTYEDIGGLHEEIKKIREMVELPLKHPEIFERLGIEAPKGVLLHGPPGTGKTLLAKAVANESNSHFLVINGPEIMSKFYGQSEENLRKKFEEAEKNAPSLIFIDEIDAIAPKREEVKGEVERRVVAQLLSLMDGLKSRGKVVVIAASNVPNMLDPALRRPGRFDREIEIGVPSREGRKRILQIHTRNMPITGTLYNEVLGERLKKKRDYIINNLKQEKTNSRKELFETESEINNLNEELIKLEKERSTRDDTLKGKVLNLITRTKSRIETKKEGLEILKKKLIDINNKSEKIDKLKRLFSNKKKVEQIVKNIRAIERLKEIWKEEDPRNYFLKLNSKHTDELKDIIGELLELKIIDESLYREARQDGILRDLNKIAEITYGFVGADLAALSKEAAMIVLRRILPELKLKEEGSISKDVLEKLYVSKEDFKEALKTVRPSALREVLVEKPTTRWSDIGGLETVKQELLEAVEWPLKSPEIFKRMGIKPPKGILLYGAPGTGKTLLAKAITNESKANFISVKGPELLSKWVGESEKAVREIFKKARQTSPTIIFFDEIDSLAPRRGISQDNNVRESVVNQLLTEMDGLEEMQDVVIIAASNRPDIIDPALLRPGRFDRIILTPIPDLESRKKIFEVHTKGMPLKNVNITTLAERTEGYVGADIEAICREAAIHALRENIKAEDIKMNNFNAALTMVRPSVTKDIEKDYEELKDSFKAATAKQMREDSPNYFG